MSKKHLLLFGCAAGSALMMSLCAAVYRMGGFSPFFGLLLMGAAAVASPLMTVFYRFGGAALTGALLAAMSVSFWLLAGDAGAAVLACVYALGIPLVLAVAWRRLRELKNLTLYALPAAGLLQFGGLAVFCRLHWGSWDPGAFCAHITARLLEALDQIEQMMQTPGSQAHALLEAMQAQGSFSMETLRAQMSGVAFLLLMQAVYLLLGVFYFSLLFADRLAQYAGEERFCGSWSALVPGRRISMVYMGGYLAVTLFAGESALTWQALFILFGFYYVFTALYRFRRFLIRRGLPPLARVLLIGLLLAAAWATSTGALISVYTVLEFIGWWLAVSFIRVEFIRR